MPILLAGAAALLAASLFASKSGDAIEKSGNAGLKIGVAVAGTIGVYLLYKGRKQ